MPTPPLYPGVIPSAITHVIVMLSLACPMGQLIYVVRRPAKDLVVSGFGRHELINRPFLILLKLSGIVVSSNYNRANDVCACGVRLLERLMSTHQNRRLCSRPHSHESVIFSYVCCHSYFLRYGHFVEYMNMHAMN